MSDPKQTAKPEDQATGATEGEDAQSDIPSEGDTAPEAEAPQDQPAQDPPTQESQADAVNAEIAALRDKALRAVAEAENVRRRADKEKAETIKYGASSLAREMLPVIDNLRRAVESVPEEARAENETLKNLMVGVEMTEKMLLDGFAKHGIIKLDPIDQKFSHAEHQAMSEAPGTGKPAGTVVQVLQSGYKLHDRLLRPAMVIVAKGEPAPPPEGSEGVDTTA